MVYIAWDLVGLAHRLPSNDSDSLLDAWEEWENIEDVELVSHSYLACSMWFRRIKRSLRSTLYRMSKWCNMLRIEAGDFGTYTQRNYGVIRATTSKRSKRWIPPPQDCIKQNADTTIGEDGWVGLGVVARDHQGVVLFATTSRSRARWLVAVAEGKDHALP